MSTLLTVLKYLPELVGLIKLIIAKTEEGVEAREIRRSIKAIHESFNHEDAQARARDLNNVFRRR